MFSKIYVFVKVTLGIAPFLYTFMRRAVLVFISTVIWYHKRIDSDNENLGKRTKCIKWYVAVYIVMFLIATAEVAVSIGYLLFYDFAFPLLERPAISLVWLCAIVFFFFTAYALDTPKRIKVFVFVFVGLQVFRVLEPLFMHFQSGYWKK